MSVWGDGTDLKRDGLRFLIGIDDTGVDDTGISVTFNRGSGWCLPGMNTADIGSIRAWMDLADIVVITWGTQAGWGLGCGESGSVKVEAIGVVGALDGWGDNGHVKVLDEITSLDVLLRVDVDSARLSRTVFSKTQSITRFKLKAQGMAYHWYYQM